MNISFSCDYSVSALQRQSRFCRYSIRQHIEKWILLPSLGAMTYSNCSQECFKSSDAEARCSGSHLSMCRKKSKNGACSGSMSTRSSSDTCSGSPCLRFPMMLSAEMSKGMKSVPSSSKCLSFAAQRSKRFAGGGPRY